MGAFSQLRLLQALQPVSSGTTDAPAPVPQITARPGTYIAGPYATQLSPPDEQRFQQWVKANKVPWQDSATADYDMRGYWQAMNAGDPNAKQAGNLHFPDTYKTPYHATFSNESQYATPSAPRWVGNRLIADDGTVIADESPKKSLSPAQAAKIRSAAAK